MADSLVFDGVDDLRQFTAGSFAGSGASTTIMILKAAGSGFRAMCGDGGNFTLYIYNTHKMAWQLNAESQSAFSVTAAEGWVLMGVSRAAGAGVTPNFHKYVYGTATWTHSAGTAAQNNPSARTNWYVGANGAGEFGAMTCLICGVWDSELSDGTIETLELAQDDWTAAAPDEAWRFDTTGTITPFVGTSTQTSSTGGTLATGDVPAGWSDGSAPVVPTPQLIYHTQGGRWR